MAGLTEKFEYFVKDAKRGCQAYMAGMASAMFTPIVWPVNALTKITNANFGIAPCGADIPKTREDAYAMVAKEDRELASQLEEKGHGYHALVFKNALITAQGYVDSEPVTQSLFSALFYDLLPALDPVYHSRMEAMASNQAQLPELRTACRNVLAEPEGGPKPMGPGIGLLG